jgi:hypothetical protein
VVRAEDRKERVMEEGGGRNEPERGVVEVRVESDEPGGVHGYFAALEAVPEAVRFALGDAVVYPAGGDVECEFIV